MHQNLTISLPGDLLNLSYVTHHVFAVLLCLLSASQHKQLERAIYGSKIEVASAREERM